MGRLNSMRALGKGVRRTLKERLQAVFRRIRGMRSGCGQPLVVVLTHSPHTKLTFRLAAFREEWHFAIATSLAHVRELLRTQRVIALAYDLDSGEADWRRLCCLALECGAGFHLIARDPSDDLFLAVISAGGGGVLAKPITPDALASAIQFALSLADTRLAGASQW